MLNCSPNFVQACRSRYNLTFNLLIRKDLTDYNTIKLLLKRYKYVIISAHVNLQTYKLKREKCKKKTFDADFMRAHYTVWRARRNDSGWKEESRRQLTGEKIESNVWS